MSKNASSIERLEAAYQKMLSNNFCAPSFQKLPALHQQTLVQAGVHLGRHQWVKDLMLSDLAWLKLGLEHCSTVGLKVEEIAASVHNRDDWVTWYNVLGNVAPTASLSAIRDEFLDSKATQDTLTPGAWHKAGNTPTEHDKNESTKILGRLCVDCMKKADDRVVTFFSWLCAWQPMPVETHRPPAPLDEDDEELFDFLDLFDETPVTLGQTVASVLQQMNALAHEQPQRMQDKKWTDFYEHLLGFSTCRTPAKDYEQMHALLLRQRERTQLLEATSERGVPRTSRGPKVM